MHARCLTLIVALLCPAPLVAGVGKKEEKPAADKPLHVFRGTLDPKDLPDPVLKKSPHKVHEVKLVADKLYVIDLVSKDFDAFLRLEDPKGKPLAQDDDGGGAPDARLLFALKEGGTYRVVVTAYPQGPTTGAYTLTVRAATERDRLLAKARRLHQEGARHYGKGDLAAAERLLGETLELWRQSYPKDRYPHGHPDQGLTLAVLGELLRAQGKYDAARDRNEQALAVFKNTLPPDHLYLATALNNLGLVLRSQARYAAARDHIERAVAIFEKTLLPEDPLLALSLNNLGEVLREWGKPDEARALHERALALLRKSAAARPLHLAITRFNLGQALRVLGRLDEARAHLEAALSLRKKALPPRHPELARSLSELGVVLKEQGKVDEAHAHFEQALAIDKEALPPGHPELASSLNRLAGALRTQGRYDEARPHLDRALAILKAALPPDHPSLASCLLNLGTLLSQVGNLDGAREHTEQALAIYRKALPPGHSHLAGCLSQLGLVLQEQGELPEAAARLGEALAIWKKAARSDRLSEATVLNNLGYVLYRQGELDKARACHEEALAIRRKALPPGHLHLAFSLSHLGAVLMAEGRPKEGLARLEEALAISKKTLPADHPHLGLALGNVGGTLQRLGRPAEAWPLLVAAANTSARRAAALAAGSPQAEHAGLFGQQRVDFAVLLSAAAGADVPDARRLDLLACALDVRALSAAALLRRRGGLLASADSDTRALADDLLARRRRLADLLLRTAGADSPGSDGDGAALRQEADALERDLAQRLKPFADLRDAQRATPAAVAARLPAGTALVELVRYHPARFGPLADKQPWAPPRYAALLLWMEGGARVSLADLGAAAPLEKAIAAWRAAVQAGRADAARDGELRRLLWVPLEKALPKDTRGLLIAPEGELALVPFEALRLEDGKYLIERYAVGYVTGGRDLMPAPQPGKRSDLALVVADPAYDSVAGAAGPGANAAGPGLRFRSLPGFAREADAAVKLLRRSPAQEVVSARGVEASEEALLKTGRPRLLYLVTHGFFLEDVKREPPKDLFRDLELGESSRQRLPNFGEDPRLRSGLALAGANKWQERSAKGLSDGLLTALEVENLDLWGTELVVLSACDTGRGEVQVGEGVLGLRRAFQLAGAQTVLASLWKVPDAETERLMTDTLSRWLKGAAPHEALREAQLAMIRQLRQAGARNGKQGEAPPLYWAGFVCHGAR